MDVEKSLDKVQDPFLVALHKLKGKSLILIKDIYKQSTINIILPDEKLTYFPVSWDIKGKYPLLLFSSILYYLVI